MITSSSCQLPLQLIEVKGELATRGLKHALNQKGLRLTAVDRLGAGSVFETCPESEGIKTSQRRLGKSPEHSLKHALNQKGLRL